MRPFCKHIFILSVFLFMGCYSDDSEVSESQEAAHRTSELTSLIKSVTLHNAEFDDVVDNSSCFSLVFPYQLYVNSKLETFTSAHDIANLDSDDTIEIVFPVSIAFFNYSVFEVNSYSELTTLKNQCEEGFDIEPNSCVDFSYPVTVKDFNELHHNFQTHHFTTNEDFYLYLEHLHDLDVYEIVYPVSLLNSNSYSIQVESNSNLINILSKSSSDCD